MSHADAGAMAHEHDEHHDPHLAHHFESREQQDSSNKLGMWAFLATEILMFGGLFCGYAVWRSNDPLSFEYGHLLLDTKWGFINTLILIASSFTMAWGVRAAQMSNKKLLNILLALTLLGGLGFMVIKYIEYTGKFSHGIAPGEFFNEEKVRDYYGKHHDDQADHAADTHHDAAITHTGSAHDEAPAIVDPTAAVAGTKYSDQGESGGPAGLAESGLVVADPDESTKAHAGGYHDVTPEQVIRSKRFFDVYFLMTGLHGVHVLVGMGLIGWLFIRALKGQFSSNNFTAVDLVGLYWHLVDLIWIFLFPLMYLID